jgi:hypothetical protein
MAGTTSGIWAWVTSSEGSLFLPTTPCEQHTSMGATVSASSITLDRTKRSTYIRRRTKSLTQASSRQLNCFWLSTSPASHQTSVHSERIAPSKTPFAFYIRPYHEISHPLLDRAFTFLEPILARTLISLLRNIHDASAKSSAEHNVSATASRCEAQT